MDKASDVVRDTDPHRDNGQALGECATECALSRKIGAQATIIEPDRIWLLRLGFRPPGRRSPTIS